MNNSYECINLQYFFILNVLFDEFINVFVIFFLFSVELQVGSDSEVVHDEEKTHEEL